MTNLDKLTFTLFDMKLLKFALPFLSIAIAAFSNHSFAGGSLETVDHRSSIFDEIRFGVMAHDIEPGDNSEDGVDINLEVLFGKPSWTHSNRLIHHFIRPRPHIGGHINTAGDTSMFYFGLTWDHEITKRLFLETSFGGAVHNGPRDQAVGNSYGCKLNFRESATLGYKIDKKWRLLVTVDHMSNANLCDRNSGLTNAGARLGYEF